MSRRVFPVLMLLLLPLCPSPAEQLEGVCTAHLNMMEDSGIQLFCNVHFEVSWKVWTMMGEPVEESVAVWMVPNESRFELTSDFWKSYPPLTKRINFAERFSRLTVPKEVMQKIRMVDLLFYGPCHTHNAWTAGSTPMGIRFDPGVMMRPFVASSGYANLSRSEFRKLPAEERGRYWSFNCPGSPDWGKMFWDRTFTARLSPADAKKLMMRKDLELGLTSQGGDPEFQIVKAGFDLSPVRDWLIGLEEQAVAQMEKETAQKEGDLAAKDAARKKAEEKDFWGTPASTDTPADRLARQNVIDSRAAIGEARKVLATEKQASRNAVLAIDALLDAKRKELGLRPKPGEGPRGALVQFTENGKLGLKDSTGKVFLPAAYKSITLPGREERIRVQSADTGLWGYIDTKARMIVPCTYRWVEDFSEGLAVVLDNTTVKRGFIDTSGVVVIPCQFGSVSNFKNGYACFYYDDPLTASKRFSRADSMDPRNWNIRGCIDRTGRVVIPPSYQYSFEFDTNGVAKVWHVLRVGPPHDITYVSDWQLYKWKQITSYERYLVNTRGEKVGEYVTGDYDSEMKSVGSPE